MKFYVYTKTAITCSYHIAHAKDMEALVVRLRGDGMRWQLGKVFGHRRVTLDNMPHKDAIMIAGNAKGFIAVEDAQNAIAPAYEEGEAYWVMH